ncbi:unnamed protein product [marine sediment metagenome]|uniref:Uncharacterized protein n=1 Tax=marine sediment metagenome TaxID=412755 RepID=X0X1C5_9ZZZZ
MFVNIINVLFIVAVAASFMYMCIFALIWISVKILNNAADADISNGMFACVILFIISILFIYVGTLGRIVGPVVRFISG